MNHPLVDFLVSNVFGAGTERHQEFIQDLVQGTRPGIFMTPFLANFSLIYIANFSHRALLSHLVMSVGSWSF